MTHNVVRQAKLASLLLSATLVLAAAPANAGAGYSIGFGGSHGRSHDKAHRGRHRHHKHRGYYYPKAYPYGYGYPRRSVPFGYSYFGYGYPRPSVPFGYNYWGYRGYGYSKEKNYGDYAEKDYRASDDRGWQLLGKGRAEKALRVFSEVCQRNPDKGIPKVGYALASAATGDRAAGAWAMRRAFRIDPDSVHYAPIDHGLRKRIGSLIEAYKGDMQYPDRRADTAFMLAALYYLTDDISAARDELAKATEYGDHSASATNLEKLIAGTGSGKVQARHEDDY